MKSGLPVHIYCIWGDYYLLSTVRHVSMIFCDDGLCKFVTTHTVNDFATVNTLIFSVYLLLNISQLYKFDANVL